jgi:hypothetical protein
VNFPEILGFGSRLVVNRLAEQVEHPAEGSVPDRHLDCRACVSGFSPANQTVCASHRDTAHGVVTDVLRDFGDKLAVSVLNFNRVKELRQLLRFKPNVKHRAYNLYNCSDVFRHNSVLAIKFIFNY